jgi:hypothetical protein
LDVDAGMLLQEIDARARPLDLAADTGRHGDPSVVGAGEIFDGFVDGAVLLDQLRHDIVDGLQALRATMRLPTRERHDVMAGPRLLLGGDGQEVLVTLRGDVVDLHLDLVLRPPFLAQRRRCIVGARHPVVPEAHVELAAGLRMADMGHGQHGARSAGRRKETTTCQSVLMHEAFLPLVSRAQPPDCSCRQLPGRRPLGVVSCPKLRSKSLHLSGAIFAR